MREPDRGAPEYGELDLAPPGRGAPARDGLDEDLDVGEPDRGAPPDRDELDEELDLGEPDRGAAGP